jgi:hypothetical protein
MGSRVRTKAILEERKMAHNSYNPHRARHQSQTTVRYEPEPPNPFLVVAQLLGIFLALRLAMIVGGITIINIPYLDLWLRMLVAKFKK